MEEIDLHGIDVYGLHFIRMVFPLGWQKPFAVVRLTDENDVEHGLRFDTGKQVFLDGFKEGSWQEQSLHDAVDQILIRYREYVQIKNWQLYRPRYRHKTL